MDELSVAPGAELEWITAGNDLKGDRQWFGQLQDLCVFDRILSEQELGYLYQAGRSGYPSRNSAVRQAALERSDDLVWSTYVVRRSIDQFTRRRYTAEDGLPANKVQAVVQTRDGYLWIGTDMGLARFDGQRFRAFTENTTAALAEVGVDVLSLVEAPNGNLWAAAILGRRFGANSQRLKELGLSSREAEVLHWLCEGKTNPEITQLLGPCRRTVDKHVEHILAKLGVESRAAAARVAQAHSARI